MGGRPVELFTADTGGVPANTRSKTQELVERNNVSAIIGPLAAFEALAIDDYTKEKRGIPVFSVAAAEDITQRHPDPVVLPRDLLLRAMRAAAGGLCPQGAGLQDAWPPSATTSPMARSRTPASSACSRTCGRPGSCRSCGRR